MQTTTIDGLPVAQNLNDSNRFPINQNGTTRRVGLGAVKDYIQADVLNGLATEIQQRTQGDINTLNSAKTYTDQAILGGNEWLAPVMTTSQLQTVGLSNKRNYLCKVIADPVQSGVYQAVAGWTTSPQWVLYNTAVDLVSEPELTQAVNAHNINIAAHDDIRQDISDLETNLSSAIDTETQTRTSDISQLQQNIDDEELARENADIQLQNTIDSETQARQQGDENINAVLDGVKSVQLSGAFLTRVINGLSPIAKNLFDLATVFVEDKTFINDENGTTGVYIGDIDSATIEIRTITNTTIGNNEPTLLGNVNTNADLPLTVEDAELLGWNTPRIDDYARVSEDETKNGKTVEWYISVIDTSGNITWSNPVIINTGDYQEQSSAQDSGRALTGGASAGTFGESLGIDPVPTENSTNLTRSGGIFTVLKQKENHLIGEYKFFGHEPDPLYLAENRLMPLKYQIIEIAFYQELCDLKWVGSSDNATADWWYKCDVDGTRNVDGQYMRVEDPSGLFFRIAGQNAIKTAANNTPYDGKGVGEVGLDRIQNITGAMALSSRNELGWYGNAQNNSAIYPSNNGLIPNPAEGWAAGNGWPYALCNIISFNASRSVRTGYETNPVFIAVVIYIRY